MSQPVESEDIEVFSQGICRAFETMTGEEAFIRSAYLLEAGDALPQLAYSGLIRLSGGYQGGVCFTTPRQLLTHMLFRIGQQDYSEADHCDLVGEMANTLSGNAQRYYGNTLAISPPSTFINTPLPGNWCAGTPYAIPFQWHGYEAALIVGLKAGSSIPS